MAEDAAGDVRTLLRGLPSLQGPYEPVDWASFPATPQEAFVPWLLDAIRVGTGVTPQQTDPGALASNAALPWEPHAMTLSTVDAEGRPDARVVILKNVDARGWHFAARADSPKGRQLQANPACSLTFYWSPLGRQVRIRGYARLLPPDERAADFLARPLPSRVTALASKQSDVMGEDSEAVLAKETQALRELFDRNPDYVSPAWLVYAVVPTDVEFWQGKSNRQHGRLRYVRAANEQDGTEPGTGPITVSWKKERLWP